MRLIVLSAVLLCCLSSVGFGQERSSAGKEFWLCFQQNYKDHIEENGRIKKAEPLQLELYLTAEKDAEVRIRIPGLNYDHTQIVRGKSVVTVLVDSAAQVRGSEEIIKKAIHIQASQPISVYGLNRRFQTTDTYLALPVEALGKEYMVMAYPSLWQAAGGELVSQIAVVATDDNTQVRVTPSTETRKGRSRAEEFIVVLNKGDVYPIRAAHKRRGDPADLTGTVIKADKPVSVFSGHSCTYVPVRTGSCNHLVEQVPPTNTWGKHFYVGQFRGRSTSSLRVLAAFNETRVFENFDLVAVLQKGETYENSVMEDNTQITADRPVLVAQFAQGYRNGDSIGDPMMILVSPTQQFQDNYRFATPINGAWDHYVNIVVPQHGINDMRLNGAPLSRNLFSRFGTSDYFIAQIDVPFGTHTLAGSLPFGMYSYGFGFQKDAYDAYGNMGGQNFKVYEPVPDTEAPSIEIVEERGGVRVYVRDNRVSDLGLRSISAIGSETMDIENLSKPVPGVPQSDFFVRSGRTDTWGSVRVEAADIAGNVAVYTICYLHDKNAGTYGYELTEGEDAPCEAGYTWYWGGFFQLSHDFLNAEFSAASVLAGTSGDFGPAGGYSGFLGGEIGKRLNNSVGVSASLTLESLGGTLHAYDTAQTTVFVDGSYHSVQEGTTYDQDYLYLSLAPEAEWYVSDNYYLFGGLSASVLVSSSHEISRNLISPASQAFEENGERSRIVESGSDNRAQSMLLGATGGFGLHLPLDTRLALSARVGGRYMFSSVIADEDWRFTRIPFFRFGLRYSMP